MILNGKKYFIITKKGAFERRLVYRFLLKAD